MGMRHTEKTYRSERPTANDWAGASRALKVLRLVCPAALAVVLLVIWLLTVQTPTETTSLSDGWAAAIAQVTGLAFGQAAWVARKVVHTFEFFPVGFFLGLTAVVWRGAGRVGSARRSRHTRVLIAVISLCFLCSLGDQVHKIFVPGREFDALDMCFDAAGYLLGVWLAGVIGRRVAR
jgi:hypothetical protein